MASTIPTTQEAPSAQWGGDTYQVDTGKPAILLASADPQRRSVNIFTDPDSAGILYVTPSAGSSSGGFRLLPGAGYTLRTGAAVYGRAMGGDVLVNVVTETGAVCS